MSEPDIQQLAIEVMQLKKQVEELDWKVKMLRQMLVETVKGSVPIKNPAPPKGTGDA